MLSSQPKRDHPGETDQRPDGWERRRGGLLAILLSVSLGLRVWLAMTGGQGYWPDEARYSASTREAVFQFSQGAPDEAWKQLIGQADHLFFKIAGLPIAWWEFRYGEHPAVVAVYFGLFSTFSLGLIFAIARAAGAGVRESLLAVFFAAGAHSLFYYCRHFFPYDLALFFCLLALWLALGKPVWWRSLGAGLAAGFGFLSYNGYWMLGGLILTWHVLAIDGLTPKVMRAAWGLAGLLAPITAVVLIARGMGHDLIASFREFSRSITQGDFGEGHVFVWRYLWDTEGVLLAGWVLLAGAGWTLARTPAARQRLRLWLGAAALLYLGLVLCADVFKSFVVYGRTARTLVPFFCLGAATGVEAILSQGRWPRWAWAAIFAILLAASGVHLATALRQVFPDQFLLKAEQMAQKTHADQPGLLRLLNVDRLPEGKVMNEPRPHKTLLQRAHPLQFMPYLYEGYSEVQRRRFSGEDISMRLVAVPSVVSASRGRASTRAWRLRLRFPQHNDGVSQPLLTGGVSRRANFIYVQYVDAEHVRFEYDAWELGGVVSAPVKIDYTQEHELIVAHEVDLHSQPRDAAGRVGSLLLVMLDGQTILAERPVSNAVDPQTVFLGLNFAGGSTTRTNFTGEILAAEKFDAAEILPLIFAHSLRDFRGDPTWGGYPGLLRLRVKAPAGEAPWNLPLLRSGRTGTSDTLFLTRHAAGIWRIGFSHEPEPPIFSEPVTVEEMGNLLVTMGSSLPPLETLRAKPDESAALLRHRVSVIAGGRLLLQRVGPLHPATPAEMALGGRMTNSQNAPGPVASVEAEPVAMAEFFPMAAQVRLGTGAEHADWMAYPGALRLRVRFASRPAGTSEPLIVTGVRGAGDIVFMRHLGDNRIAIGHDHWGVGASLSEPVTIQYDAEHELIISHGGLFPPDGAAACYLAAPAWRQLRSQRIVILDGKILLAGLASTHPSRPDEIYAGINAIGGSSAVPVFSGEILEMGRSSIDSLKALAIPERVSP